MSEVKILKVQKKGKKYLVYTNLDFDPVPFTEDGVVDNRIIKNAIFDEKTWKKIVKSKDQLLMFDKVLHYIDYKPRTTKEIINYLEEKEVTETEIEKIIKRLKDVHYLDDDKYTKQFIDEAIKNKKGPVMVKLKLQQLGIVDFLINKYLVNYSLDIEMENAFSIAIKYQKQNSKYPTKKQKELIYQKLIRDGFNSEIAIKVLNNLNYNEDSFENLEKEYLKLKDKGYDYNKIITALLSKGYQYENIKKLVKK